MLIGENYKIESDTLNVTLSLKCNIKNKGTSKPTQKQIGEIYWRPIAYFSSPQNAFEYLINRELMGTELKDIQTIMSKINELHVMIKSLNPKIT